MFNTKEEVKTKANFFFSCQELRHFSCQRMNLLVEQKIVDYKDE